MLNVLLRIFLGVSTVLFLSPEASGQARLHLSGNAFLKLSNSAFLVLENGSPNALLTSGAGGNILSENETNRIRWNVTTHTGIYTVPWTSPAHVKIPLILAVTSAGLGAGGWIDLSTWKTSTWDNNNDRPSDVTNMNGNGNNYSAYVLDRFWVIRQQGYSTAPATNIIFGYDDGERTTAGNTITQGSLGAQRYNSTLGTWDLVAGRGTDNYPTLTVSGIAANATNFYQSWMLTDGMYPLPIQLINFVTTVTNMGYVKLDWQTESEIQNDYFEVERSDNGQVWEILMRITGAGNSMALLRYHALDESPYPGRSYYRLRQVDVGGRSSYSSIRLVDKGESSAQAVVIYPNPVSSVVTLLGSKAELVDIKFYSLLGQDVGSSTSLVDSDEQSVTIDVTRLSIGMYILKTRTSMSKMYKYRE